MLHQRLRLHLFSRLQIAVTVDHRELGEMWLLHHSAPQLRAPIISRFSRFSRFSIHRFIPSNSVHEQLGVMPHSLLGPLHIQHHAPRRGHDTALHLARLPLAYPPHQMILRRVHAHFEPQPFIRQPLDAEQRGLHLRAPHADHLPLPLRRGFLRRQLPSISRILRAYRSSFRR